MIRSFNSFDGGGGGGIVGHGFNSTRPKSFITLHVVAVIITMLMTIVLLLNNSIVNGQDINSFTGWEKDNLIKLHNDYRFDPNLTPPALDMNVLEWNDTLASVAALFVDQCIFSHNDARPLGSGENIYISLVLGMSLGSDAIKAWAAEKAYFTHPNTCQSGKACYHYTQMMWSNASQIGCARKKCSSIQGLDASFNGATMMVCNYDVTYDSSQSPYTSKSYLTREEATSYTQTLLTNVKTIPTMTASYFFPHGTNAFPLLISGDKVTAVGASYYRLGRVCAFGHEGYLHYTDTNTQGDINTLIHNCMKWTTNDKKNATYMMHGFSNSNIYSSFNGMKYYSASSNAFDEQVNHLDQVDLLVLNLHSLSYVSKSMLNRIRSFLKRGGGIITGVTGWAHSLSSQPTLFPGNVLFSEFGLTFYAQWYTTQSPLSVLDVTSSIVTLTSAESFNPYWVYNDMSSKSLSSIALDDLKTSTSLNEVSLSLNPSVARSIQTVSLLNSLYNKFCKSISIPFRITTDDQKKCTYFTHLLNGFDILSIDNNAQVLNGENYPGISLTGETYRNAPIVIENVIISSDRTSWQCTGFYALPGSTVSISVNSTDGISYVVIGGNTDDISRKDAWPRWPLLSSRKYFNPITKSTGTFINYSGGKIYLYFSSRPLSVNVTISGQVIKVPYFKNGVHTNQDWNSRLKYYPAPQIEIEGTHFTFTVKNTPYARNISDIQAVAVYWGDGVLPLYYDILSMQPRSYKERLQTDLEISAGYMHSGYPIMTYDDQDEGTVFANNHASIKPAPLTPGRWGHYHELGHNFQSSYWTYSNGIEVTVNIFSLLAEEHYPGGFQTYGDRDYNPPNRQGYEIEYMARQEAFKGDWTSVGMLFQVDLVKGFGWIGMKQFFATYYNQSYYPLPVTNQDKLDQWLIRYSDVTQRNLVKFFELYNITLTDNSKSIVNSRNYKQWMPNDFVIDCSNAIHEKSPCLSMDLDNNLNGTLNTFNFTMVTWSPIRPYYGDYFILTFYGRYPKLIHQTNITLQSYKGSFSTQAYVEVYRNYATVKIVPLEYVPSGELLLFSFTSKNSYFVGEMKTTIRHYNGQDVLVNLVERELELGPINITLSNETGEIDCLWGWSGSNCEISTCYGLKSNDPNVCYGKGQCIDIDTCQCMDINYFGPQCSDATFMSLQDVNNTRNLLLDGVKSIPNEYSMYFNVHGPNAFPLFTSSDSNVPTVVASTCYGKGRIIAFGANTFLNYKKTTDRLDFDQFWLNSIKWLTKNKDTFTYMLHGVSESTNFKTIKNANMYIETSNAFDEKLQPLLKQSIDLLVINLQDLTYISDKNRQSIRSFLERGGSIVTGVLGWWYPYSDSYEPTLFPGNILFADLGITFITWYPYGTFNSFVFNRLNEYNVYWKLESIIRLNTLNSLSNSEYDFIQSKISEIQRSLVKPFTLQSDTALMNILSNLFLTNCTGTTRLVLPANSAQKKLCIYITTLFNQFDIEWYNTTSINTTQSGNFNLDNLMNHPQVIAAKTFPGIGFNNTSSFTIDESIESINVNTNKIKWYSSGYYVLPGSIITITISNTSTISNIIIGGNIDSITKDSSNNWNRWPIITKSINIDNNYTNTFTTLIKDGGIIYFNITKTSIFTATIKGKIVKVPHFNIELGHTNNDWLQIRNNPSPIMEIEGKNIIITVRSVTLNRQIIDIESVINYWDNVITLAYDLSSRGIRNYKERIVTDYLVSTYGYIHSGYPIGLSTLHDNYMLTPLNNVSMVQRSSPPPRWDIYEYIGANFQESIYTYDKGVGVLSNIYNLYIQEFYPTSGKLYGNYNYNPLNREGSSYMSSNADYKGSWSNVAPLFHLDIVKSFGWISIKQLFETFNPNSLQYKLYTQPTNDEEKRNQWLERLSKIVNRNLIMLFMKYNLPISTGMVKASTYSFWTWYNIVDCQSAVTSQSPCASVTFDSRIKSVKTVSSVKIVTWNSIRPYNGDRLIISFNGIMLPSLIDENNNLITKNGTFTNILNIKKGLISPHVNITMNDKLIEFEILPLSFILFSESIEFSLNLYNPSIIGSYNITMRHVDKYNKIINVEERTLEKITEIIEKPIDGCNNKCSIHGNCLLIDNIYKCKCENDWDGDDCSSPKCNGKSTWNGGCNWRGQCQSNHTCLCDSHFTTESNCTQCTSGYTGIDCSQFTCYGKSNNNACSSNGKCIDIDKCQCNEGYSGIECEIFKCYNILNSNTTHVCSGRGNCTSYNECKCPNQFADGKDCSSCNPSFSGINCDIPTCSNELTCYNNGKCNSQLKCDCFNGFTGEHCNECIDNLYGQYCNMTCTSQLNCSSNGICQSKTGKCICNERFSGNSCSECKYGWYGENCDFTIFYDSFTFNMNGDSIIGKINSSFNNRIVPCSDLLSKNTLTLIGTQSKCIIDRFTFTILLSPKSNIVPGNYLEIYPYIGYTNNSTKSMIGLGSFTPLVPKVELNIDKTIVSICDSVSMDASGSTSMDRRALSFKWELQSSPSADSSTLLISALSSAVTSSIVIESSLLSKLSLGKYTIKVIVTTAFGKQSSSVISFSTITTAIPTLSIKEGLQSSYLIGTTSTITPLIKFPSCYSGDYKTSYTFTLNKNESISSISNIISKDGILLLSKQATNLDKLGDYYFTVTAQATNALSVDLKFKISTMAQSLSLNFNISDLSQSKNDLFSFEILTSDPSNIQDEIETIQLTCQSSDSTCPMNQNVKKYSTYLPIGTFKYTAIYSKGNNRMTSKSIILKSLDLESSKIIRISIKSDQDLTIVNPSKDLYLTYQLIDSTSLLSNPTYSWSSSDNSELISSISNTKQSIFKIPSTLLSPGLSFKVTLTILDGDKTGTSETLISVNSPPTIGLLEIYPESGYALTTQFDLKCSNGWTDDQTPLTFEFKYLDENANQWISLSERTESKSIKVSLPIGFGNSSLLQIKSLVYDSLDAYSESSIQFVKVMKPESNEQAITALSSVSNTGTVTTSSVSSAMAVIKSISPTNSQEKEKISQALTSIVTTFFDNQQKTETLISETSNSANAKLSVISSAASNVYLMSNGIVSLVIQKMQQTTSTLASTQSVNVGSDVISSTKQAADTFNSYVQSVGVVLRYFSKIDLDRLDQVYDNIALSSIKNSIPDMPASIIVKNDTMTYSRKLNIATCNNLEELLEGKNKFRISSQFSSLFVGGGSSVNIKVKTLKTQTVSNSVSKAMEFSISDKQLTSNNSIAQLTFETSKNILNRDASSIVVECKKFDVSTGLASSTSDCTIITKTASTVSTSIQSTGIYVITAQTVTNPVTEKSTVILSDASLNGLTFGSLILFIIINMLL